MSYKLTTSLNKSLSLNKGFFNLMLKAVGVPHLGTRVRFSLISKILPPSQSLYILDAGCGYGFVSLMLAKKGFKVLGVDQDNQRVQLAKQLAKNNSVRFIRANLYKLPFKDRTFDMTLCLEVLEHVKDDLTVLKELKRVTKKEGKIIISFPEKKANEKGFEGFGHVRPGYSLAEFKGLAEKMGLKVVQFIPYGQSIIGKSAFQIDYNLARISPIFSSILFPILYPLAILDQSFPVRKPWNYVAILSK